MAAHPSNPALVNPMGRAAWWATGCGRRSGARLSACQRFSIWVVCVSGGAGGREEVARGEPAREPTAREPAALRKLPRDPRALFTLSVSRIASFCCLEKIL